MSPLRVLPVHTDRLPYATLHCGRCKQPVHTHAAALTRPARGVSAEGAPVYTSWCGGCKQHFNWTNVPVAEWMDPEDNLQEQAEYPNAITPDDFRQRAVEAYGEAGEYAVESMCLTEGDYLLGYDHCMEQIAPALEEELLVQGGEMTPAAAADVLGPEAVLDQFIIR